MKPKDSRRKYKYEISVRINTVVSYLRTDPNRPRDGTIVAVSDTAFFIETELEVLQMRAFSIKDAKKDGYVVIETANGSLTVLKSRLTAKRIL